MPCVMKKPAAITPILKSMSKNLGIEKEMLLYRLKKNWSDFVGHTLALHTAPERLKFKTLTLRVDGPTWMHELSFLKRDMIKKINTQIGKNLIQTLHLKIGSISLQDEPKRNHQKTPAKALSARAKAVLQEALSGMEDSSLKEAIKQAMERHLRKKEGDENKLRKL